MLSAAMWESVCLRMLEFMYLIVVIAALVVQAIPSFFPLSAAAAWAPLPFSVFNTKPSFKTENYPVAPTADDDNDGEGRKGRSTRSLW